MRSESAAAADDDRTSRWSAARMVPVVLARAAKGAIDDQIPTFASAVAFNAFLAIPATLLLVVGLFSLTADPQIIEDLTERLGSVAPAEAVTLVEDSLLQLERQPSAGLAMTIVGFVLALWTATGAMTTLMAAVNRAHDLEDRRNFAMKRLVAVVMVVALGSAMLVVSALLVLGPHLERWIGEALEAEDAVGWIWWTAEWPLLLVVLFCSFSVVYALATDHSNRRWRLFSPGAAVAVVLWLVVSAGFSFYAASFGSYNKTWGSLSAAIVTLVWLWLSALALLYGAEVDAEADRSSGSGGRSRASRPRLEA